MVSSQNEGLVNSLRIKIVRTIVTVSTFYLFIYVCVYVFHEKWRKNHSWVQHPQSSLSNNNLVLWQNDGLITSLRFKIVRTIVSVSTFYLYAYVCFMKNGIQNHSWMQWLQSSLSNNNFVPWQNDGLVTSLKIKNVRTTVSGLSFWLNPRPFAKPHCVASIKLNLSHPSSHDKWLQHFRSFILFQVYFPRHLYFWSAKINTSFQNIRFKISSELNYF